jgi:hypothetical protein
LSSHFPSLLCSAEQSCGSLAHCSPLAPSSVPSRLNQHHHYVFRAFLPPCARHRSCSSPPNHRSPAFVAARCWCTRLAPYEPCTATLRALAGAPAA